MFEIIDFHSVERASRTRVRGPATVHVRVRSFAIRRAAWVGGQRGGRGRGDSRKVLDGLDQRDSADATQTRRSWSPKLEPAWLWSGRAATGTGLHPVDVRVYLRIMSCIQTQDLRCPAVSAGPHTAVGPAYGSRARVRQPAAVLFFRRHVRARLPLPCTGQRAGSASAAPGAGSPCGSGRCGSVSDHGVGSRRRHDADPTP